MITTHPLPDADAMASAFALKRLYPKAQVFVPDENDQSRKIAGYLGEKYVTTPDDKTDLLIAVDIGGPELMRFPLERAERRMLIDHHQAKHAFLEKFDGYYVDTNVNSTSEIAYKILKENGVRIDKRLATLLCAGIYSDSISLRIAKPNAFRVIAELTGEHNINFSDVVELITFGRDVSEKIARFKACQRARVERVGDYIVATTTVSSFTSSAAQALRDLGADISFAGSKRDMDIKGACKPWLVERGFNLGRDVMPLVGKTMGGDGGGHPGMAGARGTDETKFVPAMLEAAKLAKQFLESVKK